MTFGLPGRCRAKNGWNNRDKTSDPPPSLKGTTIVTVLPLKLTSAAAGVEVNAAANARAPTALAVIKLRNFILVPSLVLLDLDELRRLILVSGDQ